MAFMLRRRTALATALAAPFIRRADAAAPIQLRASVDTSPSHGRTMAIADYLKLVEAASDGQITTKLFDSGQLYADKDVIKALVQHEVEMAAPGTWLISSYVPDADMLQLPAFYGQPLELTRRVVDGPVGTSVDEQLAQKLRVRVPGKWIELGYTNWYSTKRPLHSLDDLKGLKIRNSGGYAQAWRARFFGAIPNMTAWPAVPLALSQGTFDALQTTNESIASVKLWDSGVRYALIDHQVMSEYVPMISDAFLQKLSPALRQQMFDIWNAHIDAWRKRLLDQQSHARGEMTEHGVSFTDVPADVLAQVREAQLKEQDQVAKEMKISPDMLAGIMKAVAA